MAAYAKTADEKLGSGRWMPRNKNRCSALLTEAGVLIDAVALDATLDAKRVASCRMVRRAIGDGSTAQAFPLGATQGGVSALGYAQNWTLSGGSTGGAVPVQGGETPAGRWEPHWQLQPGGRDGGRRCLRGYPSSCWRRRRAEWTALAHRSIRKLP